jgi:hypothetical protein
MCDLQIPGDRCFDPLELAGAVQGEHEVLKISIGCFHERMVLRSHVMIGV